MNDFGPQALLILLPALVVMAIGIFRLEDQVFRSTQPTKRPARKFCGMDEDGCIVLTDPDGRTAPRKR